MKRKLIKVLKWTGILLPVLVTGLGITVAMRQNNTFEAPYPQVTVSQDSAVIARGKYLVYGPAHCASCHVPNSEEHRVDKGEEVPLSGGRVFDIPPGKLYSSNITSDAETGIGNHTDADLARMFRYGVAHDGKAVFDFMPFQHLSEEDLTAVTSYLRTLQPVKNQVPEHELNPLGYMVNAFLLKPVGPTAEIPKSVQKGATAEYGKYLAYSVANCRGCHTSRDMSTGQYTGPDFAGGLRFDVPGQPGSYMLTPNITPDPETGRIVSWSESQFVQRFRQGKLIHGSEMPWGPYSRMTDDELKAIYRFLQTVEPVNNKVPLGVQKDA